MKAGLGKSVFFAYKIESDGLEDIRENQFCF
jgi:hypothetical protein